MSAKLIVQSDGGEEVHWIEFPVVRVGSGRGCDIHVQGPDVVDHHLTIEFSDGRYRVHNRSSNPISIGKRVAPTASSLEFKPGETLHVNRSLSLTLEVDGDAAPSPHANDGYRASQALDLPDEPNDTNDEEFSDPAVEEESDEKVGLDPKAIVQVAVIGLCLAGCAVILLLKMIPTEISAKEPPPSLAKLLETASSGSDWDRAVAREAQLAEGAWVRNDKPLAIDCFMRLRDELVQHQPTTAFSTMTKRFVEARLLQAGKFLAS